MTVTGSRWQLRDVRGSYGVWRGSYGMYVALTGCTWLLRDVRGSYGVYVTLIINNNNKLTLI